MIARAAMWQCALAAVLALTSCSEQPDQSDRPVTSRDFPRDAVLSAVRTDKKFAHGAVRFVVCPRLGSAHLATDVTLEDIRAVIATL